MFTKAQNSFHIVLFWQNDTHIFELSYIIHERRKTTTQKIIMHIHVYAIVMILFFIIEEAPPFTFFCFKHTVFKIINKKSYYVTFEIIFCSIKNRKALL